MRCFFCLELPQGAKDTLAQAALALKAADAHVRWVRLALLHITLKFLGEIDPEQTPALQALVQQTAKAHGPFKLTLDGFGAFPHLERPRVLWVGASHLPTPLVKLQAALDEGLEDFGFERERNFSAHVTLGRVRERHPQRLRQLSALIQAQRLAPQVVPVEHVTLMESVLKPGGPQYAPLFRVAL